MEEKGKGGIKEKDLEQINGNINDDERQDGNWVSTHKNYKVSLDKTQQLPISRR